MFVIVTWSDAEHPTSEWQHKADVDRSVPLGVETCGFLVGHDKHRVQVAVSVCCRGNDEHEQYTGIMTIPRGCIVSIREVTAGKAVKL